MTPKSFPSESWISMLLPNERDKRDPDCFPSHKGECEPQQKAHLSFTMTVVCCAPDWWGQGHNTGPKENVLQGQPFFFFWHVQILTACCVYSGHSILLKLRSPHGLFSLSGWKQHQWAMLQAKKGCCLVGPLCDSQDLGFEDLWSVQCGEVYEPWVVPGKTQLFWMKILILHIAMPQRYMPVRATTNESKWVLTATPQMAS